MDLDRSHASEDLTLDGLTSLVHCCKPVEQCLSRLGAKKNISTVPKEQEECLGRKDWKERQG